MFAFLNLYGIGRIEIPCVKSVLALISQAFSQRYIIMTCKTIFKTFSPQVQRETISLFLHLSPGFLSNPVKDLFITHMHKLVSTIWLGTSYCNSYYPRKLYFKSTYLPVQKDILIRTYKQIFCTWNFYKISLNYR